MPKNRNRVGVTSNQLQMKTIFLTWLVALITHNYGWQIPIGGYPGGPPQSGQAKTSKGELIQAGSDALLLLQEGTKITEFYVLQDVSKPVGGFENQYFDLTPGGDKLSIGLADGVSICIKNEGVSSKERVYSQTYEGGGLVHFQFTADVEYKRFVALLQEYKNYQQVLGQIDYELLVGPGNGGSGSQSNSGPRLATNCEGCSGGGYGAVGCGVSSASFSCSVQCPPGSWACCSVVGGCRCCR
ncbi:MAG: hypothetical protein HUU34_21960 [Saprospiraceae bacterium]|nr:hypothetical protein [Saprospiraceae bacterium]